MLQFCQQDSGTDHDDGKKLDKHLLLCLGPEVRFQL